MNRLKMLLLLSLLIISCCEVPPFKIFNLSEAKNAVQSYYESGSFDAECSKVIDDAIKHITKIKITEKSCVIFDIDETALSNYTYTKEIGFGYIYSLWVEWQKKAIAPAIKATKYFYDYLISKNIRVIFLTGRTSEVKESTNRNLIEQGYVKFDTLIVRTGNENKITSAEFKAKKREELVKNGYDIIACIGDQWSDLVGGNAGYKIKLPSYLYLID
jgi:acid phosphatase